MTDESCGYIAVNKDEGRLVIMMEIGYQKHYAYCNLENATDVITGKRGNSAIWRHKK